MLYRENGQFKTSYVEDQQILPIMHGIDQYLDPREFLLERAGQFQPVHQLVFDKDPAQFRHRPTVF